jgi:hypothetical protein
MDRLAGMEVFLVAYTLFNLNLEIFAGTRSNRQQGCAVCPFFVIKNTITKVKLIFSVLK